MSAAVVICANCEHAEPRGKTYQIWSARFFQGQNEHSVLYRLCPRCNAMFRKASPAQKREINRNIIEFLNEQEAEVQDVKP